MSWTDLGNKIPSPEVVSSPSKPRVSYPSLSIVTGGSIGKLGKEIEAKVKLRLTGVTKDYNDRTKFRHEFEVLAINTSERGLQEDIEDALDESDKPKEKKSAG